MIVLLMACVHPDPGSRPDRGGEPATDLSPADTATHTSSTGETGHTGDTATTATVVDCSLLVEPEDITWSSTDTIVTEEDFDFDAQGYLLMQRQGDLQGVDRYGVSHPIAPGTGDPTGVRSLASGIIALAKFTDVVLVDPSSGASRTLLSSMSNANGLEAGEDGMLYVAENSDPGKVRMIDPMTGAFEAVAQAPFPNGIVLSHDEQVLYFTSSNGYFGDVTRIMSVARDANGDWDDSTLEILYTRDAYVGSLTIDACDNLYGVEYMTGRVFRRLAQSGEVQELGDLGSGAFSALHFSPGLGGWDLNTVYVTSRGTFYAAATGVPGSHVHTP